MEKLYIKCREVLKDGSVLNPDSPIFFKVAREAERLGYEVMHFYSKGICLLGCDDKNSIITGTEEDLIRLGYKEHFIGGSVKESNVYNEFEKFQQFVKDVPELNDRIKYMKQDIQDAIDYFKNTK